MRFALVLLALMISTSPAVYLGHPSLPSLLSHVSRFPSLVMLTVPWCDHSRALLPQAMRLVEPAERSSDVVVALVNAEITPAVAAALNVNAYPTILYVPRADDLGPDETVEFADFRWAELIGEFVNNQTGKTVLEVGESQEFTRWRQKNPWNLGMSGKREEVRKKEEGMKPLDGIREPEVLDAKGFEEEVFGRGQGVRFMVLFYEEGMRETLREWRQAASAFLGSQDVRFGVVETSGDEERAVRDTLGVETGGCVYFGKCQKDKNCGEAQLCGEGLVEKAANVVEFLTMRVGEEIGVMGKEMEEGEGRRFWVSKEEFERMKKEGKVMGMGSEGLEEEMRRSRSGRDASKDEL